jgi:formate/nitrite transporter FocA (FNT family)
VSETPTPEKPAKKRPRHLMDPDNPVREVKSAATGSMHLEPVQKWVLSILAAVTIAHLAAGLVIAAMYVDDSRTDAQIGLNILAGAFGVIAVVVFRTIHQLKPLSVWLLLGLIPTVGGLYLTFR